MIDKKINICIITRFIDNYYFGTLIKSIQSYINKIGGCVYILNTYMLYNNPKSKNFIPLYFSLAQKYIDGYIVLPQGASDEHIIQLSKYYKPVVLINKTVDEGCQLVVKDDGFTGMSNTVDHLINQGHRKIAFIGWFELFDMFERFEGYKHALIKNGIPFIDKYVHRTENVIEVDGKEAAKRILECTPEVTAVVAANDLLAYGAMELFQSAGLKIPEDIAVCGYDNSSITLNCNPQMTSVEQNIPQLGEAAAKALTEKIFGKEFADSVINISPKLIVRKSSMYSAESNSTNSFTFLDKSTSIELFRYLEKFIFNSFNIGSSLKKASFENINEILPQIPPVFERACYGEWIYENNLPKCLLLKNIYKFSPEETITGKEYFLEDFPPKQLMFEPSHLNDDEVLFIMPIRSDNFEMGVFSYVGPINKNTEFINVNFSSLNYTLLSFVMDRELFAEKIKKKNSEKISAINTMVAGIAHELNTPIGIGISASSFITDTAEKLLQSTENGTLKRQDFIKMVNDISQSGNLILDSMNKSSELVKTFKLLSFFGSDEIKKFNVKQNTEAIITLLKSKLKQIYQNIIIICDDNLEIISYPNIISHILTNLITNSIVHGFDNKTEGRITIEYQVNKDRIILLFEDNGKGMDKEVLGKIFDAFFTTKRAEGAGLGLNIVYNLVKEYLQGTIYCESEIGKGARFIIEFPVKY